jgi:hypothetical protein
LQLALAIVKEVVDQLNAVLETFADSHRPMVRYFDLRHVVLQNDNADWYDELHPSKQGANKVANVFEPALPVTVVAA